MHESEEEMLNTDEVLKELRISKTTLYRLMREDLLTPVDTNPILKRQNKLQFKRSDVERLKPPAKIND